MYFLKNINIHLDNFILGWSDFLVIFKQYWIKFRRAHSKDNFGWTLDARQAKYSPDFSETLTLKNSLKQ